MKRFKPVLTILVSAIMLCGFSNSGAQEANFAAETAGTATWIKKAAEKYLESSVESAVTSWRIAEIKTPRDKTLPEDFDRYKITDAHAGSKGKTRVLNFIFYKNERVVKRLNVTCKLEFFADVVVARSEIRRGGAVTMDALETASRKIEQALSAYYTEIAQVKGQMALRKIASGKAILKSEIGSAPDIKSGEIVLIVAEKRRVMATARGVAKKNGKIGEMIPVVNLRSNKKIYARVTGVGQVEVAF